MKRYLLAAAVIGLAILPVVANATEYTSKLEYSAAGYQSPAFGTVTLTEGAGYVDVLVNLNSTLLDQFIANGLSTGRGGLHDLTFGFNLVGAGDPGLGITPTSIDMIQPNDDTHFQFQGPGDYNFGTFHDFQSAISDSLSGNGNFVPPLEFKIYQTGISFLGTGGVHFTSTTATDGGADVDGVTTPDGWWFAADVRGTGDGNPTFAIAARDYCVSVNGVCVGDPGGVPEPATWGLMLLGFGGLGAMLRRRRALAFA